MSKPIRILCVFSILNRGGAESMCMNLYRRIDKDKLQFDFVKHTHEVGAFEEEITALGGRVYSAPKYRVYNHLSYCNWWKKHLSMHPEHKIIHGHFFSISPIYFKIAKRLNRVTVAHSHSTIGSKISWKTRIRLMILKSIEDVSSHCFACSQEAGQWLFPHRDFTVLNNAVDTQAFRFDAEIRKSVREELGLNDAFVAGIVGSLSPVKNPFGTIEIFKAIHRRNPNAKLLWVGGGVLRKEIEEKLKEEGLIDAVIMTGVRSDVNRLLQAMDVFILPSLWEGLPVVLMEAQAAGLPCFISDTVTKEAAITDMCTYLPNSQPERWVEAILEVDPTQRCDTSQQIIEAGYDIRTTANWLEEFYLSCLN